MSEIALRFLFANLAASGAILLVIALRKRARVMFGARLAYALWLLVPLAIAASQLPPRIEIAAPVVDAASQDVAAPFDGPAPATPSFTATYKPNGSAQAGPEISATMELPALPPTQPIDWMMIGLAGWIVGVAAMLVWQVRNQSRFMADARAGFAGPAVAGFFFPRIVTPGDFEERFESGERELIIAHETIHLDRNDARINAAVALVRCACWFNPLIHLGAYLMRIDQELACDATVAERHPREKAVYASALLKAQLAARPLPLGCYWPARDDHPLTERIEMLKSDAPNRRRKIAGAAAIVLLAVVAGCTAWTALPPEKRAADGEGFTPVSTGQWDGPGPFLSIVVYGTIEKMDFGATSYVTYVRASGIAARDGATLVANTDLWRLRPVNYFGDPDARAALEKNLLGHKVAVQGSRAIPKECDATGCRPVDPVSFKILEPKCETVCDLYRANVLLPTSTEAPQPREKSPLMAQFGTVYNTTTFQNVLGKVERIEFADRTFDAYVRATANSRLYQVRSEYSFPRAEIERALMNKTIQVGGWSARQTLGTFCDPVCGMYASRIEFEDRTTLEPMGDKLLGGSAYLQRPRGDFFMAISDLDAPITVTGKITRYIPDQGNNTAQLWLEATAVSPATTTGAQPGTKWVVSGFPFDPADDWIGKTAMVRGFNAEDKRCQPTCLMAGAEIQITN